MYVFRMFGWHRWVQDFEYDIELDPNKPRVQNPHKVVLSVELRLKKENKIWWESKANLSSL